MRVTKDLLLLLLFNALCIMTFIYLFHSCEDPSQVQVPCADASAKQVNSDSPANNDRPRLSVSDKFCMVRWEDRHFNKLPYSYDSCLQEWIDRVIEEKRKGDDSEVVNLARHLLEPPSKHLTKTSRAIMETPQSTEIKRILNDKQHGYFIEVGAFDGERSSNSLWFETRRKWTGLLIEMDPYYYTMVKGHSRNAWTINCCLSIANYPALMDFIESDGGTGKLNTKHSKGSRVVQKVPCMPLHSLLLALNQTHIDYFSLDVEGVELDILKTIPFDKLHISTLSVEFLHGEESGQSMIDFMNAMRYDMVKKITTGSVHVNDYIFVKRQ